MRDTWGDRVEVAGDDGLPGQSGDLIRALSSTSTGSLRRDALARRVFDTASASMAVLDDAARIRLVNPAWEQFGRDNGGRPIAVGTDYLAVCDAAAMTEPAVADIARGLRAVLIGTLDEYRSVYAWHRPDRERWFELTVRPVPVDGRIGVLVVHEDVTDRRRMSDDGRTQAMLGGEGDAAVVATDPDGLVTSWSRGAQRLYGWAAPDAVGRPVWELLVGSQVQDDARQFVAQLGATETCEGTFTATRPDSTTAAVHVRNVLVRDSDGLPTGMIWIAVDVTEQLALDVQLRAITDSIGEGLCTLDRHGHVIYVNPAGRRMLRASPTEVLDGSFRHWLHAVDSTQPGEAAPALGNPAQPVQCTIVRRDGTELPLEYVATPLRSAVVAPANGWVVVFRDLSAHRARQAALALQDDDLVWLGRIRDALDHDGFELYAQPIVDILTGVTVQHELLLRMRDPDDPGQMIAPGRFLPAAEKLGMAPAIDWWVLSRGLELAARGHPVEINVSARSIEDAALPHLIEQLLDDTGADPTNIGFELTETALLDNNTTARYFADRIHELGCGLALDDFGTGFGGFTYLKQFPLDCLKIDIEFIGDAVTNPASRHVIEAVVSLAASFDLRTVAEGVEDQATLDLLGQMGVDLAQGYLLGKPAPIPATFPISTRTEQR